MFKQCKRKSYTHVHPSIPLEGSGGWRSETETCESIQSVQIHQHNPKNHANISKQVQYWRTTRRLPLAVSNDGSVLVLILSVSRSKSHSRHYTGVYNTESDLSPSSSELEPLEFSSITRECLGKEEEEREGEKEKKSERKKRGKKKRKEATWYLLFLPDTVTSVHLALWLHQSRRVQCSFPTVDRLVMV